MGIAEPETNVVQAGSVFREVLSMRLTSEARAKSCPRFLDFDLVSGHVRVCWKFEPGANLEVLLFSSVHPKEIKRGIARLCLNGALINSSLYTLKLSFCYSVSRLKAEERGDDVSRCVAVESCRKKKVWQAWIG